MAMSQDQWVILKSDPVKMEAHRVKMREYRKTYHRKHKNTHGDRKRQTESRLKRNKAIIAEAYKVGCKLCPENDIDCLDFHHVNPTEKEDTISTLVWSSTPILVAEIAKCVVLCANCHRKLHAKLKRGEPNPL